MSTQTGWRRCGACEGLWFSGNTTQGVCAGNGGQGHVDQSSLTPIPYRYVLRFGDGGTGIQGGWRWCRKCQSLFVLNPKSVCPAGGEHDPSSSGNYELTFGDSVPGAEGHWRWCHKCQGLYFAGSINPGVCPADKQKHDSTGSGQYAVSWENPTASFDTGTGDQDIAIGGSPADCNVAVSTSHVLVTARGAFACYTKAGVLVGPGPGFTARPYHAKEFFEQLGISTVVALSNNDPAKDARVVFDVTRKRFFLVFQSRESPARLLIAVSKSENPSDGFFAYADVVGGPGELVHDYQRVGVNSNFLLVSNNMVDKFPGGNFVRTKHLMYSAASLATGKGIDRSEWWHPNAQNASPCVHNSPCTDAFYAHRDDDSHASIWAVRNGNVTSVQFSIQQSSNAVDGVQKGGQVVDFGGNTIHRDVQNSEYRDGKIVFGSNDATTWPSQSGVSSAVRLIRVDVSQLFHSPPSVTVEIDRIYGLNSENDPPNSVFGYGFPAVATNQKGDIVIGCVRSNAAIFTQLRASVWYKDQADIGPSVLLAQSESPLTAFHMAGACADPSSDGVYLAQQFGVSGGTWRIRVVKMLDYRSSKRKFVGQIGAALRMTSPLYNRFVSTLSQMGVDFRADCTGRHLMSMNRRQAFQAVSAGLLALQAKRGAAAPQYLSPVGSKAEPMAKGKFEPTWESLQQYQTPEWYRDAKFGIWAHWGAQCQPEYGDWYARQMYIEGSEDYKFHVQNYGHPSKFGFKDVIHLWKAERWDPDKLVGLYKAAGAQYFVALANHHDNFDNYDSKYQLWNSVRQGPKKDLIGGWARAARSQGLKFGVSVHAAHAWMWYEVAQGADKTGPLAGVPYDGKMTKADGKGLWWEGLDPQELYAQSHAPGKTTDTGKLWDWPTNMQASIPDVAYCERFYNRTAELINKYHPDLVYYDDTALPLYPISDAGLKLAAHFYNTNMKMHGGRLEAVLNGKVLNEQQRKCMVWDIERGQSSVIEPQVWQTDTCIGNWHYDRKVLERHRYKSAATVVRTLADVVSKNGNLLLNIPVKGDGTLDSEEQTIVAGITHWMGINRECIFGTRPWKVFGEGPASQGAPLRAQGFNEGRGKPMTADDVRFTARDGNIYVIQLGVPTQALQVGSLGKPSGLVDRPIENIALLGSGEKIEWKQGDKLSISPPKSVPSPEALVYKITLKS